MTGGDFPADSPPLTVNPVRSAWELPWDAVLPGRRRVTLTGRSWSGVGPIARVDVSIDDGQHLGGRPDPPAGRREAWTQWDSTWPDPQPGAYRLMARPPTPPAARSRWSPGGTTGATSSTPSCSTRSSVTA